MASARQESRFGLQAKVLTAVVGFLVLVPLITLWIVNNRLEQQMEDESLRTLVTAESVFLKSLENRTRNVLSRYRATVAELRFKVTAEDTDPKTMEGLLEKLMQDSPEDHDAFIYSNEKGEDARRRRSAAVDLDHLARAAAPITRAALPGEPAMGYVAVDGKAYSIVSVPVTSRHTGRVIGVLTVGARLGEAAVKELALPRTEILLAAGNDAIVSTVAANQMPESILRDTADAAPVPAANGLARPATVRHVVLAGEHFMARSGRIDIAPSTDAPIRYVMLSSYQLRLNALQETRRTLLFISLAGVIVSALVVSWFVGRLIRPLRELSETAEAVGRGDFSRRVTRFSNDECGDLAEAFNRMTTGLQTSRAELERAMQQVRTTQEQLIQSEKLSAVGQFVAGVAHELNNPLTAVVGFSELLQGMSTDEKVQGHLDRIAKSAHRCHKIVHSLLSFARQQAPERKLVELRVLTEEVLEIMSYDLRTSNVTVVREFADNLPQVMADPHQLQQVFVNIFGNARQAMESFQRDGRVVVRTRRTDGTVVIEFEDNGPGIKPEHLARIFDPFFTTKPVGKGTGLGLSLCYGIIQEHGGKIYARSEPGQGATFVIELPVPAGAVATPAVFRGASIPPFPTAQRPSSGKTILVIDDEAWILELAAELLRTEGHTVETAIGGQQALELLGRRKYDVIVSDWKMPGLNGVRLYEHLRATDSSAANRVLFMTGDVVSDAFQDFLRTHQLTCLSKPFATGEFRAAVSRMFGGASP